MKLSTVSFVVAALLSTSSALPLDQHVISDDNADSELRTIQTGPNEFQRVTEEEKLALKAQGIKYFDITGRVLREDGNYGVESAKISYPKQVSFKKEVNKIASGLSEKAMEDDLTHYTSYHTRYYKSETGLHASLWLFEQVEAIANTSKHAHAYVFDHKAFPQKSVIATVRGKSDDIVIVGAHLDSTNLLFPSIFAAPGADDDGSGTVTTLDVFRNLIASGIQPNNTLEFHWYAAEEGGLLGSQDVFEEYSKRNKKVKAMLQQDMTGFIAKTVEAGLPESVGIITDYVDEELTDFLKLIVDSYCDIPYVETSCGYACSDHASASKYGYPSAFVIESSFDMSNNFIHTTRDTIEHLSFSHMKQHAKMTLGYAYELAFWEF